MSKAERDAAFEKGLVAGTTREAEAIHRAEQAEAERDKWRDLAKAEGADEEHERALVAERDALRADVRRLTAEGKAFSAEVERLRDIISPGDAAAYEHP